MRTSVSFVVTHLQHCLSIDLRSLAAFRALLGLTLCLDLAHRARFLVAHYTDAGVLPRVLVPAVEGGSTSSLHALSGDVRWLAALFVIQGLIACAMCVERWSRIATAASWLLLLSLHVRNPLVVMSGDRLVALLLMWASFLPSAGVWGRGDARNTGGSPPRGFLSAAGVVLLLQVVTFYVAAGLSKQGAKWWSGMAIDFALGYEGHATPAGAWLRGQTWLTEPLTYFVLCLEFLGPVVALFSRGLTRVTIAAVFILFHLGLAVFLSIGLYPLFCISAWLLFLPGEFWDRAHARLASFAPARRGDIDTTARIPLTRHEGATQPRRRVSTAMALAALLTSLAVVSDLQGRRILLPTALHRAAAMLYLDQRWQMFAPDPPHVSRSVVVRLAFEHAPSRTIPLDGIRWTMWAWHQSYYVNASRSSERYVAALGRGLCHFARAPAGAQLEVDLQVVPIRRLSNGPPHRTSAVRARCPEGPAAPS